MGFDLVLIGFIVGGMVFSVAYVRAEYMGWREHGAAERRRDAARRALHAASLSEQREAALLPTVLTLEGFSEGEAANPDEVATARRTAAAGNAPRPYYPAERRKRFRQRAGH
jgi:hypothetical protein